MIPIVTIDGPSGSGKGTLAKKLSIDLKWNYLDSGLLYRCYAFFYRKKTQKIDQELASLKFNFSDEMEQVIWNQTDITQELRGNEITLLSSELSQRKEVRKELYLIQKSYHKKPGLIAEGRDMSSTVFPNSKIKIFLTASIDQRVQRRANQLRNAGQKVNISELKKEIELRDSRDTERIHSPLSIVEGAIKIDNTNESVETTIKRVKKLIYERY
jgi:cytidylate kinase